MRTPRIGVVPTSSTIPAAELSMGVGRLREAGFEVVVHASCSAEDFTFAGSDEQRARAALDHALDATIDVVWCARGGYGATRILPLLEAHTRRFGPPPRKLLVGYSDVTALHAYVSTRWGWHTLHAPMPAAANFGAYDARQWGALLDLTRGVRPPACPGGRLTQVSGSPPPRLAAPLVGGNLTVWNALTGTPFAPAAAGRILFFEDVDEAAYRVDRMVTQLLQAGGFDGAVAVILGDFTRCEDETHEVLADAPPPGATPEQIAALPKRPLRRTYRPDEALALTFARVTQQTGAPVLRGLPVGHGPNFAPLPLNATYRLDATDGSLELADWGWLTSTGG